MFKAVMNKLRILLVLTLTIFVLVACQSEPEEEVKEKEILGGSLAEFETIDMFGADVDQSIFEKADVNLIFVWASG